jgi:hypothetical protein
MPYWDAATGTLKFYEGEAVLPSKKDQSKMTVAEAYVDSSPEEKKKFLVKLDTAMAELRNDGEALRGRPPLNGKKRMTKAEYQKRWRDRRRRRRLATGSAEEAPEK